MKIELIEVSGFKSTLTALRKPFKGQIRTDVSLLDNYNPIIHEDDLKLLKKLVKAGDSHAKCVRGINITLDITAPRFFWSEHDTYSVSSNPLGSESSMHTILNEDVTYDSFDNNTYEGVIDYFIDALKGARSEDVSDSEKIEIIKCVLPDGYLQARTIQYNYQGLRTIYFQRKNHRLPHWREFCAFIETLPLSELITLK